MPGGIFCNGYDICPGMLRKMLRKTSEGGWEDAWAGDMDQSVLLQREDPGALCVLLGS
jgi:hypothetical protein